jgi:hemerythrin-like metal-binding protein
MIETPETKKSPDSIEWREGFKIGVSQADQEHRHMFDLVQALDLASVEQGVAELLECVAMHFSNEQDMMEKSGYPALEQHVKLHEEFVDQVTCFLADGKSWSVERVQELRLFLDKWMIGHIMTHDLRFGLWFECDTETGPLKTPVAQNVATSIGDCAPFAWSEAMGSKRIFTPRPTIPIKYDTLHGIANCRTCGMRGKGLFADLNDDDLGMIHAVVDDLTLAPGATLFQEGGVPLGIFTLRKGAIKLVRTTAGGTQRIVRVLSPGDMAGLEALAHARYYSDAVALTEVSVCRIPRSVIHALQVVSPRLNQRLMEKWAHTLKEADDWLIDINFGSARSRVSNFVLKMRGVVDDHTVILFSREEMGTMMGLTMETVSRVINALVREGTLKPLDKHRRLYRILNLQQLQASEC